MQNKHHLQGKIDGNCKYALVCIELDCAVGIVYKTYDMSVVKFVRFIRSVISHRLF